MATFTTTLVTSGSPVTLSPFQDYGATFAMPTVDGGNLDLVVTNAGVSAAWLSFAANAPVGANVPGCLVVPGGASLLLTANPATLAAAAANPAVLNPQNGAWQAASSVSALVLDHGSKITLQRGTATARQEWR